MDSDFLQALCALAAVFAPMALAWWIAGRGDRAGPAPPKAGGADAHQERPRCYPLRSDL